MISTPSRTAAIAAASGATILVAIMTVAVLALDRQPDEPVEPIESLLDQAADLEGEPAPDFALTLIDGSAFSLSDHIARDERPLLLNFWASWCVPCRKEMPALDAAASRHPNVAFLGIAIQDDPVAAAAFADEIGVDFPLGIDERGDIEVLFPSFGLPVTWLISEHGVVLTRLFGEVSEASIDAALSTYFGG